MMCWSYFGSFPSTMCKDPNIDNDNIAVVHLWTMDDMCEKNFSSIAIHVWKKWEFCCW